MTAATAVRAPAYDGVGRVALSQIDVALNATSGIAGVRALILDLAIRGRLLDDAAQTSPDEGREPFPIPDTWRWATLGSLCEFINGDRSKNYPSKQHQVSTGVPFINAGHLRGGRVNLEEMNFITEERFALLRSGKVQDCDVLYCLRGSLGKCAVVRSISKGAIASSLLILRPQADLLSEFLYRCMTSPLGDRQVREYDNGTAQPNLSAADVRKFLVPLPPLAEQKRIVAKVDQLMALCDELEAQQGKRREVGHLLTKAALAALTRAETSEELKVAWKRVLSNFDLVASSQGALTEVRATIVELGFRGLLTGGNDHRGDPIQLLETVRSQLGPTKLRPVDPVLDAPFAIPRNWKWVRWGDLTMDTSSGWSPQCQTRPREGAEWGVLKVSAVSWLNFDAHENKALPPDIEPRPEFAVRDGDFLMSRANTSDLVGRSVVVGKAPQRLILSDKIVRCSFAQGVETRFLNFYNRTSTARAHYIARASGTSDSMKNISREVILSMPVPLAPLDEQRRVVSRIEALLELCDQLEAKIQARDAMGVHLAQALANSAKGGPG